MKQEIQRKKTWGSLAGYRRFEENKFYFHSFICKSENKLSNVLEIFANLLCVLNFKIVHLIKRP